MINGNAHYKTKDTPLAAYLITEGFELINVENNSSPSLFVFKDSDKLHQIAVQWHTGNAVGNCFMFYDNYRKCIRMLKQGMF